MPVEQVFRDQWGRVLASLVGYFGDFDLAEEATAEAFAIAAQRWPSEGTPDNPGAWLVTTARRRAIDRLRRERVLAAKLRLLAADPAGQDRTGQDPAGQDTTREEDVPQTAIPDERLELIFMCCHPALALEAQVALTGSSARRTRSSWSTPHQNSCAAACCTATSTRRKGPRAPSPTSSAPIT
jgi:RNA polymerase sigma-70 factor (ECF subfamily)